MHPRLFIYQHSPISYYKYGQGHRYIVAFHGFGQSGLFFQYFEETLGNEYTIIAIDFFWHGSSQWVESRDFAEEDMREIVIGIARQEQIFARKFSILSFSMGARMARALVRTFPERIERVVFIAPPTQYFNHFLNFTVGTWFGLFMFRYFLKNNHRLQWWIIFLNKVGVLNRSVKIFSLKFIANTELLTKVYQTWFSQRKLRTNFKKFATLVDTYHIEVILVAGKNDTITPPTQMIRYIKQLSKRRLFLIPIKHELQTTAVSHVLSKIFISK
jgi:pimeloyl-ACP methyl ester carboxylesterase